MKWEIWCEGYAVTGNESGAHLMGCAEGESFENACRQFLNGNSYFNPEKLTYWGCRLFDNEADARKTFG